MQQPNRKTTIKALMKNGDMAKLMQEAVDSPIGSTPRKRAQKIVSIMKKVGAIEDGKADNKMPNKPEDIMKIAEYMAKKQQEQKPKRVPSIIPAPPERRTQKADGQGGPGMYDGKGGTGSIFDRNASLYSNNSPAGSYLTGANQGQQKPSFLNNSSANTPKPTPTSTQQGAQQQGPQEKTRDAGAVGDFLNWWSGVAREVPPATYKTAGYLSGATEAGLQNLSQAAVDATEWAVGDYSPYRGPGYTSLEDTGAMRMANRIINQGKTGQQTPADKTDEKSGSKADKNNERKGPSVSYPQLSKSGTTDVFTGLVNKPSTENKWLPKGDTENPNSLDYEPPQEDQTGSEYNNLLEQMGVKDYNTDPYSGVQNPNIKESLDKGLSPSAFAYKAMNDPEMLRSLPGFENVPDDALPYGASLAGQVGALAETLRKESGIDAMMDQYQDMLRTGGTLGTDLTDYIRGRDEFLNETQGLIDDFKDKTRTMDMANPVIAQRAKQYNDYLHTLKGRQNKRYIEVLNSSLETQQNTIENTKAAIETTLDDLESKIDFQGNLAVDEYERIYNALVDTYTQAAGLPELEMSRATAQNELYNTAMEVVSDSLGTVDTTEFNEGFLQAQRDLMDFIYDEDNRLTSSARNLGNVVRDYGDGTSGINSEYNKAIFDVWKRGMKEDIANIENVNEIYSAQDQYITGLYDYLNAIGFEGVDENENKIYNDQVAAHAQALKDEVKYAVADAIREKISSADSGGDLRAALRELSDTSLFGGYISRKDFINKYRTDALSSSFLGELYDVASAYIEASPGEKPKDIVWQIYTDKSKYKTDPGLNHISDQELLDNVLTVLTESGMGPLI